MKCRVGPPLLTKTNPLDHIETRRVTRYPPINGLASPSPLITICMYVCMYVSIDQIAKIVAARVGVPVFGVSAPGIAISHKIFDVPSEVIQKKTQPCYLRFGELVM